MGLSMGYNDLVTVFTSDKSGDFSTIVNGERYTFMNWRALPGWPKDMWTIMPADGSSAYATLLWAKRGNRGLSLRRFIETGEI